MPDGVPVTETFATWGNGSRNYLGCWVPSADSFFGGPLVQTPFDTMGRGLSMANSASDMQYGPLGGYSAWQGIGPSMGAGALPANVAAPAGILSTDAPVGGAHVPGAAVVGAAAVPEPVIVGEPAAGIGMPRARTPSAHRAPTFRGPSRGGSKQPRSRSPLLEWQDETGSQQIVAEEYGNLGARENDPAQEIVEKERGNASVRAASPAQQVVDEGMGVPRVTQNGRALVDRRKQSQQRTGSRQPEKQPVYVTDPRVVRHTSATPGHRARYNEESHGPRAQWNERPKRQRAEPRTQWNERPPKQSMRERIFGP